MLAALLSAFTAKAADDFSVTVNWDTPGSISVSLKDLSGNPVELDPAATSIVVNETGYIYLRPAKGYLIKSVTDAAGKQYRIAAYKNYGGQYVGLSCYSSANGNVYQVTTEKLEKTGELELDVLNGDYALEAYLVNRDAPEFSTFTTLDLKNGSQKFDLTAYDTELVIERKDSKAIWSLKKNGEDAVAGNTGGIAIADGDKIEVQAYETEPERVSVTIEFTEGAEGCLASVFNEEFGKITPYSDIQAAGGAIICNAGTTLRFNFNEDYKIKGISVNGTPAKMPEDGMPFKTVVTENSVVLLDAAPKVYEDIKGVVYVAGPIEALRFATGIMEDDVEIPISEGEELTTDVVFKYSNGKKFVIEAGTAKKYTLMIPGKSRKFFYDALPGYWIVDRILAKPDDPDYPYASLGVIADNIPLYIKVASIENDTKAVVYYEGEENAAAFYAQNVRFPGRMEIDGVGGSFLPCGYSMIEFDADYHESFSVGKGGGLPTNEILAYLDGKKLKFSEESLSYSGIKLTEGSVLKVFSVRSGTTPDAHSVTFDIPSGISVEVTYDLVKSHDPASELQCIGSTKVTVKPSAEAKVLLDGTELTPDAEGCYEFTTTKKGHILSAVIPTGVTETEVAGSNEEKIFNLQGISVDGAKKPLPAGVYIVNGKKVIRK